MSKPTSQTSSDYQRGVEDAIEVFLEHDYHRAISILRYKASATAPADYSTNAAIQNKLDSEKSGIAATTSSAPKHANGVPASVPYDDGLKERLKDPEYAFKLVSALMAGPPKEESNLDNPTEWDCGCGQTNSTMPSIPRSCSKCGKSAIQEVQQCETQVAPGGHRGDAGTLDKHPAQVTKSDNAIDEFIKAYESYPSQDNEGHRPDRAGFKCGFLAAWDLLTARARNAEQETLLKRYREALEGFRKYCIKPDCQCWACLALGDASKEAKGPSPVTRAHGGSSDGIAGEVTSSTATTALEEARNLIAVWKDLDGPRSSGTYIERERFKRLADALETTRAVCALTKDPTHEVHEGNCVTCYTRTVSSVERAEQFMMQFKYAVDPAVRKDVLAGLEHLIRIDREESRSDNQGEKK